MTKTLNVGDILTSSWGYDQTNVDFYQVVKVSAAMVTLRKIESREAEGDGWTGKRVPVKDAFLPKEKELRRKLKSYDNSAYVMIESYAMAKPWDGKPQRYSAYA